jgi:predicted nuclease of predicted toxin-antitoxin system
MKFLVDANLPPGLATWLREHAHEATHISDQSALALDDRAVFEFARHHGYIIMTKDEDFAVLATLIDAPAAVVWLRLGNATNSKLRTWLRPLLPEILQRLAAGETLIEVV